MNNPLPRLFAPLCALLFLSPPAWSTWSIVAVRRSTGEVAVASATCLLRTNLQQLVPAVVVGRGAAAAQAAGDGNGRDRMQCADGFRAGLSPQEILDGIEARHSISSRQYGIVSFDGPPVTFSGVGTDAASTGVSGQVDDILYAIQGNVLAGNAVITAAEQSFLEAGGDLVDRVMAGMKAARALGGDGRCSCRVRQPTSCGAPPASFTKTAHVGFMIVARVGDLDGDCNRDAGCANGDYYFSANVVGNEASPDPVFLLAATLDVWRQNRIGRPDHVHSTAKLSRSSLPADGRSTARVTVELRDIDGRRIPHGGARVHARVVPGRDLGSTGPVSDNGDGTYTFELTAGRRPGLAELEIRADDGFAGATLYPFPAIRMEAPVFVPRRAR